MLYLFVYLTSKNGTNTPNTQNQQGRISINSPYLNTDIDMTDQGEPVDFVYLEFSKAFLIGVSSSACQESKVS